MHQRIEQLKARIDGNAVIGIVSLLLAIGAIVVIVSFGESETLRRLLAGMALFWMALFWLSFSLAFIMITMLFPSREKPVTAPEPDRWGDSMRRLDAQLSELVRDMAGLRRDQVDYARTEREDLMTTTGNLYKQGVELLTLAEHAREYDAIIAERIGTEFARVHAALERVDVNLQQYMTWQREQWQAANAAPTRAEPPALNAATREAILSGLDQEVDRRRAIDLDVADHANSLSSLPVAEPAPRSPSIIPPGEGPPPAETPEQRQARLRGPGFIP